MCHLSYLLIIWVLGTMIQSGSALDCYACNVSTSALDEDGCLGIGSVRTCNSNSVCLAATYKTISGPVITFTNMQSCFPIMNGQECANFFKTQRDLHRSAEITPVNCYACSGNNCNKSNLKASTGNSLYGGLSLTLISIGYLCIAKLLILYE